MSRFRATPTAGSHVGVQGRYIALAALIPSLVATVSMTVVLAPSVATADEIAALKVQAKVISEELIQEQLQIGAYQQQYSVAAARVAADGQTVLHVGQQISLEKRRINKETSVVRQLAITTYMNAGNELSSSDAVFTGNIERVELANEYTSFSAGNIDSALDRLHTSQRTLQTHQALLQRTQVKDRAEQARQAAYLAQAISTQHEMDTEQAQVTGQLAAVVAQQAAAQAAAAAAAVAAAQRAAAQKAAAQAPVLGTTAVSGPITDPVLNPYLMCVVQAESGGNYAAVSPNGLYMGAFQFSQATWNMAAQAAGLPSLVGVPPNLASKAAQDSVAVALYALDGQKPWLGDRCS